jgi:cell wall-associated NlpC family hydrolase
MMKTFLKVFLLTGMLTSQANAGVDLITPFPLEHYSQNISQWINPNDADYDKPLMNAQQQALRYDDFYQHEFGAYSPWNVDFMTTILNQTKSDEFKASEQSILDSFNNQNKKFDAIGYGENYLAYMPTWNKALTDNINLSNWEKLTYDPNNRAIAIANLSARELPTTDPFFYDHTIAGEGYPFDMLQMSSIWVGTPLYILKESKDRAWVLVLTPEFIGWVPSNGVARVTDKFVKQWQVLAKNNLAAITKTQTSVVDADNHFLFSAYVGTFFPVKQAANVLQLWVPVLGKSQQAEMQAVTPPANSAVLMPLTITPHHIADVMATLIGRSYGWGNLYFNNDCSAELKNLFTAFGIWLPRNSSQQAAAGKSIDMSSASPSDRIAFLMKNGKKFLTTVYLGGHIVLFAGNVPNPNDVNHDLMALTYQDSWGLYPKPAVRRAVLGKSLFIPMLLQYPEDVSLGSFAARKYFKVTYLDEMPDYSIITHHTLQNYMEATP